jgi:hypothetical protein
MRFVELTDAVSIQPEKILVNFDHVFFFGEHKYYITPKDSIIVTRISTNNMTIYVTESTEEVTKKLHSTDNFF